MNPFGDAWLLDTSGNCIEVYAHPSESFEFDNIVDIVSTYGSKQDKHNCSLWKLNKSEELKCAILNSYNTNWCKVRLWFDNKLTFRITSTDFNWYRIIVDFLTNNPRFSASYITVENANGKVYWNDLPYNQCVDPSNEEILSYDFINPDLVIL